MKKNFILWMSIFGVLLMMSACQNDAKKNEASSSSSESPEHMVNPFAEGESNGELGNIAHGPVDGKLISKKSTLVYDGKEVIFDYFMNVDGKGKNLGFLMFVNGIPQPYKLDKSDAPLEYMHIFNVKKGGVDVKFRFRFTPVTGKKGDHLEVVVGSVFNAGFQPDMQDTVSYGVYHHMLPSVGVPLLLKKDSVPAEKQLALDLLHVDAKKEALPVAESLLKELEYSGYTAENLAALNDHLYTMVGLNGDKSSILDSYELREDEKITITYEICGQPGLKTQTTFYANHQPIMTSKGISIATKQEKGMINKITLTLDSSKLADFTTFYAVVTPLNLTDFPDTYASTEKSRSILLYRK